MARRLLDAGGGDGWLDIGSYGRRGPGRCERLSPGQVEFIARTVRRVPEVMVKMFNKGGNDIGAVARHLKYLDRDGELEIETDEGEGLKGKEVEKELIEDWDLDLEEKRSATADNRPRAQRRPPKLVYKILFSMPAGTPPERVLAAVKAFAREEFGAKHRYAMVLHTDEPHPHVHMVVKARGYDQKRLDIRKATLREWRRKFARHLREEGVAANATERAIRGVAQPRKTDGIYRAAARGASSHWQDRVYGVARELARGGLTLEVGKKRLTETRRAVVRGWGEIEGALVQRNDLELAEAVRRFVASMPPARTEKEFVADSLMKKSRSRRAPEITRQGSSGAATFGKARGLDRVFRNARMSARSRGVSINGRDASRLR